MIQPGPCCRLCPQEARNPVAERRQTKYSRPRSRTCFPLICQSLGVSVSVSLKWGESPTLQGFNERRDGESSTDGEAGGASLLRPPPSCCCLTTQETRGGTISPKGLVTCLLLQEQGLRASFSPLKDWQVATLKHRTGRGGQVGGEILGRGLTWAGASWGFQKVWGATLKQAAVILRKVW